MPTRLPGENSSQKPTPARRWKTRQKAGLCRLPQISKHSATVGQTDMAPTKKQFTSNIT